MTTHGSSRTRPGAIRTFLIADIRGYTLFTNQLGDEAASRLAAKFAQIVGEGVEAWDGTLVELRGDEALAVFESPRQAIRCAAELQQAFAAETGREPHLPLTVGIGIDAGEAVPVGDGYRGAALNLAARLCATAAAGEIRASESVAHLAGPMEGLSLSRLEPMELKGITGSVVPVLVTSDEAGEASPAPLPHPPAAVPLPPELDSVVPLTGRERELTRLAWHWRRASHGRSRFVVLTGPEGIGKTRTAAQLAALARSHGAAVAYRSGMAAPDPAPEPTEGLNLLVIDDLDRAASGHLASWAAWLSSAAPASLTILTSRKADSDELSALIDAVRPTDHLELGPLDSAAVLEIVRLYAESAADEVPLQLIEAESEGIPAAVHRVASQWARNHAVQRLGRSAERTASGRRELRSAEEALIDDVGDLERSRERTLLFAADADADAEARASVCPYKGLAAFEASDVEYFFGRDRLVAELVAKLVGSPFVALVGASGSGKSSVLGAGLLPALANGVLPTSAEWSYVTLRPGTHPMGELRDALAASGAAEAGEEDAATLLEHIRRRLTPSQRLVVVVDQFEELFVAPDEAERLEFIELLTMRQAGLKVIVALRADQYGRAAAYPALARALGTDQVLVGPATPPELASIVERPAQRANLRVEPQLTEALVADAGDEPGALPLLSTALLELWQARTDSTLTMAAYVARGGLRGAVARLAEASFGRLTSDEQQTARSVFLRLAGEGEGNSVVRRRVPIDEFDADASSNARRLIASLAEARLLSTGDGYVEVAHEALFREWPRLARWLEDDAAGRQLRLHLVGTARAWDEAGRERGDLYRGARLAAVLDWAAEHAAELNPTERAFIDASRDAARDEANRQRATNRRLRLLLGGAVVFLVAAVAAGGIAFVQADQARAAAERADLAAEEARLERESAEREAQINRSRELAASATSVIESDPTLARLLALSAIELGEPPAETVAALRQSIAADRVMATYAWPEDRIGDFAPTLDPTGRLIAMGGWGTTMVEVIDRQTETVVWSYDAGEDHWLSPPAFTPDGELLVLGIGSNGETQEIPEADRVGVFVFRARDGDLVRRLDSSRCGPELKALSDTYAVIATAPEEMVAEQGSCFHLEWTTRELIDLTSGERTVLTRNGILEASISADGSVVAYDEVIGEGIESILTVVVDTATGERLFEIDSATDTGVLNPGTRALSPGGDLLVYGDRPVGIWDVTVGERIGFFHGHNGFAGSVAFAPDGASVYSAGIDGKLRHWDARTGREIRSFGPVGPERVTVSPDVALVMRGDGAAATIDLGARGEVGAVATCSGAVAESLEIIGGRGSFLALGCSDTVNDMATVVADLESGDIVSRVPRNGAQGIARSPDGTRYVRQEGTWPDLGHLTIRDAASGAVLLTLEGTCQYESTGEDFDVAPGCNRIPEPPFPVWPWVLRWSPDGDAIVAVNDIRDAAGGFVVWDANDGSLRFAAADGWFHSATFTPDGEELLVAVQEGEFPDGQPVDDALWMRRYAVPTGDLLDETAIDGLRGDTGPFGIRFIGYSTDGSTLYLVDRPQRGAQLVALDVETFEVLRDRGGVADAQAKSFAINPGRSRVAIGTADGYVRVWDAASFALDAEIFVGDTQVQGLAFLSEEHLAVVPETGNIVTYTLDIGELISIGRERLSRGFTPDECDKYNFGDECPSLEELAAGS